MPEISSLCFATEQLSSLCCCNPLHAAASKSLLPLLVLSSSSSSSSPLSLSLSLSLYIYIYIFFFFNFIYVLYIWFEKNILKVEFLINKAPSNTDLLPKITKFHQRFWNICWKFFRFVHALFVLVIYMIYLFSLGYWKNLWVHVLYFFFFFFCG